MILTLDQLQRCMPHAGNRASIFLECLNHACLEFGIDTPIRMAAFLAQIAHESGSLRYTREIADGSAYEGRKDLGNTHVGDGKKYPGRGLIQVTGRANTTLCLVSLGRAETDLEYLETPMGASRSAAWFWKLKGLNELADKMAFGSITKIINGGFNGLDDRIFYYVKAIKALGV
jgi:putative chitinase